MSELYHAEVLETVRVSDAGGLLTLLIFPWKSDFPISAVFMACALIAAVFFVSYFIKWKEDKTNESDNEKIKITIQYHTGQNGG